MTKLSSRWGLRWGFAALLGLAALGAVPQTASAHEHWREDGPPGWDRDHHRHEREWWRHHYAPPPVVVAPPPVYAQPGYNIVIPLGR